MSELQNKVESDRELIVAARKQGFRATIAAYTRLSGPGWLQSAITLGGGSLAGSLYLGVIAGYQLLWLQPLMMMLGVVMLGSIGYVALSSNERPFDSINRHINPVLGWGWAIATLMANLVWAMPQFSLGTAALQQNLLPGVFDASADGAAVVVLFVSAAVVVWFYDSGGWGIRLFDLLLKIMVGVIVLSFFGVVAAMAINGGLDWRSLLSGFVPNLQLLYEPAARFAEILPGTSAPEYWRDQILSSQRDRMVTAAATAVGINMTFLLPYSMLKRGWGRDFRGLAVFDLSTGLFIPFVLATSCVVIAAASQFHGRYDPGLVGEGERTATTEQLEGGYQANLTGLGAVIGSAEVKQDDRRIAAMLVTRDAFLLANSLEGLTGRTIAQTVFGIGVLGMAISSIIILMLINGFTICEMMGLPSRGWLYRLGCLLPGFSGAFGFLYLWSDDQARFWLAVPTSVFGMVLLPIAYVTFFLMMNNRQILREDRPRGIRRLLLNIVMLVALLAATVGAGWSIWGRTMKVPGTPISVRWVGIVLVVGFIGLALGVHAMRSSQKDYVEDA